MGLGEETSVGPEERGKKIHSRDVEKADLGVGWAVSVGEPVKR